VVNWVFTKQERKKDFKDYVGSALHNGGASQQNKKVKERKNWFEPTRKHLSRGRDYSLS